MDGNNMVSPKLDEIIKDIFELDSPKINEDRRSQIQNFIKAVVNGDNIQAYLIINANLKQDKEGALVYILTNARLIKIEIAKEKEISSSSFFLNSIISVSRKLNDDDQASIEVIFQNDSFGLTYSSKDQEITDFFQKVDHPRAKGSF